MIMFDSNAFNLTRFLCKSLLWKGWLLAIEYGRYSRYMMHMLVACRQLFVVEAIGKCLSFSIHPTTAVKKNVCVSTLIVYYMTIEDKANQSKVKKDFLEKRIQDSGWIHSLFIAVKSSE